MKWSFTEPSFGDVVRVAVGSIYHFGIYVSDEEVIQFGLPPSRRANLSDTNVVVLASDIDSFLDGGFLEVCQFDRKEKKKNRSPEEIVRYARSKIGSGGYHILYNNCEHFANECATGVAVCRQADNARALVHALPIADVYIAALPTDAPIGTVACPERQAEIDAATNEKVKREKYFVWKLLEYALEHSFGARGKKMIPVKESYGGWSADNMHLSLSHSKGAIAVAVSRDPIGVDIEHLHAHRTDRVADYVMNAAELASFAALPAEQQEQRLLEVWTAKEALFKSKGLERFLPKETDTTTATIKTDCVTVADQPYVWSVATPLMERVRVFTDIDLT